MIGYSAAPRFARLTKAITGDDDIVPPGLALEVDRPEWMLLADTIPWSIRLSSALLAANFSHVGVQVAASRICVITSIIIENPTGVAAQFHLRTIPSGLVTDTTATPANRDTRFPGNPSTVGWTRRQVTQQGFVAAIHQLPANQSIWLPVFFVLGAVGGGANLGALNALAIVGDVVNSPVSGTFIGYERGTTAEERAEQ